MFGVDPALVAAFEPVSPGWLIRRASFLPGIARTADQMASFADVWRAAGLEALSCDGHVVVALGDSLAQGIGASEASAGYVGRIRQELATAGILPPVLNLSRSGAKIGDVIETQLPALAAADVSTMLVMCTVGSNDLVRSARMFRTRRELSRLLELLPQGAIFATVPARGSAAAKSLNRHLRREAERLSVPIADVDERLVTWRGNRAGDRFHPNDNGYQIWVEAFWPHIFPGPYVCSATSSL